MAAEVGGMLSDILARFNDDEDGGVLGWVLLIVLLLIVFGVIGFSFNA